MSDLEHGLTEHESSAAARCVPRPRGPYGSEPQPRITTPCPSCGARSLFIGSGGALTCAILRCQRPSVEAAIADKDALIGRLREALRAQVLASIRPGVTFTLSQELLDLLGGSLR